MAIVASFVTLALCAVLRPTLARCPFDMDLRTGVTPDGSFECWPHPSKRAGMSDSEYREYDGTFGKPERSVQASWMLAGRVYCTGSTRPIVIDWHTVECEENR